jgi:uncharacterized protein (DUF433 family)
MRAVMATAAKVAHTHIVKTPGVRGGKACIDGTRVCVVDLVFLLQRGFTPEQMCTHYSDRPLTLAEVHSALAYYYDNTEEIEAYIKASDKWEEEFEARKAEHIARRAGQ